MSVRLVGLALFVAHLAALPADAAPPPTPQQPARDAAPGALSTGVIRGRVVDAQTSLPLRRVRVIARAPGAGRDGISASTDDEGRYEITEVPAARMTVSAERSGYLTLQYGQRRPRELGKPLDLTPGQMLEGVDFALPRMSAISGRITDELGEPIAGVWVSAQRWMYVYNSLRLLPDGRVTTTDADGEYRLAGLVPGAYLVHAKTLEKWTVQVAGREQTMSYAPTLFPGATDAAQAAKVEVATGQEAEGINFALVPGRAVKLTGVAVDSKGQPLRELYVINELMGPAGGFVGTAGSGTVAADGSFVILNVPPGTYKLQGAGAEESVTLPIVVGTDDIGNIALTASAGWSAKGSIVFEGTTPVPRRPQVTISAVSLASPNGMGMQNGARQRQVVNDDWSFSVSGVVGGARLRLNVPEGWVVKSIMQGDRDIADQTIDLRSGEELTGLRIVVTDHHGALSGTVAVAGSTAASDGTVLLFPSDPSRRFEGSRLTRTTRPDQQGRFRIQSVLPGDYLAVALDYVEEGSWNDPEFLESLRRNAQPVTIVEGPPQTVSLSMVIR